MAGKSGVKSRDVLIADYEWLRRMMRHLDVQSEQVDRQLVELERRLPDDYEYPDDVPRSDPR
jgi:hypothetical protein